MGRVSLKFEGRLSEIYLIRVYHSLFMSNTFEAYESRIHIIFKRRSCETNFTLEKCLCWYLNQIRNHDWRRTTKKDRNEKKIHLFTHLWFQSCEIEFTFKAVGYQTRQQQKQTISDKFPECWSFCWHFNFSSVPRRYFWGFVANINSYIVNRFVLMKDFG